MPAQEISAFLPETDDPERLAEARRQVVDLLTLAEETAGIGLWDMDLATQTVHGTPQFFRIMGLPHAAVPVPIERMRAIRHPEDRAKVIDGYRHSIERGLDLYEAEYRINHPDGQVRWILGRGRIVRDAHGVPVRYIGVDIDITERKRAEEHVRLLMREIDHRANNLLTVVLAIARQTARGADPATFHDTFAKRIAALAASTRLLLRDSGRGADLAALATSQLAPFADLIGTRITFAGPPIRLKSAAAQAIGMGLHELATNAGKYGALSNASGSVRIDWSLADVAGERQLRLAWVERDGPAVHTPQRTGFGHTVLVRLMEEAMRGKAWLDFAPAGLSWGVSGPASQAIES